MLLASVDIETTGLNPETDQILEVAAILWDTRDLATPVESLPTFHCYVVNDVIRGNAYALAMNAAVLERIAKKPKGFKYYIPADVPYCLRGFLAPESGGQPVPVWMTGKNVGSFDLQFLRRLENWDRCIAAAPSLPGSGHALLRSEGGHGDPGDGRMLPAGRAAREAGRRGTSDGVAGDQTRRDRRCSDRDRTLEGQVPMRLLYQKLHPLAHAPARKHPDDAGWDVLSREHRVIKPGEMHTFDLGLAVKLEPTAVQLVYAQQLGCSWYLRAADKSGLAAKRGIHILGGVIDSGYRGSVGIVAMNLGFWRDGRTTHEAWTVRPGDGLCQLVPELIALVSGAVEVYDFDATERGASGFGSG